MRVSKIERLIRLVEESEQISKLEVSGRKGLRVLIRKTTQGAKRVEKRVKEDESKLPPPGPKYRLIRSPYTGTFSYLELGKTPLVMIGGRVEAEQTVAAIIVDGEIKTIKSEYSGVIDMLFPEEGDSVEKGKPIYRIDVHV